MNLPEAPGRARRLAYGNYIRNNARRNNTRRNNTRNDEGSSNEAVVRRQGIIMRGRGLQTVEVIEIEYIKKLLLKDLLKKSSIYFAKDLFSCSICLNETKDNIIRRLVCNHNFHINCIEKWLSDNTTCPICRYNLITF